MSLNRVTLKYKPDDVKLTVVLEDYRNAINALVDDANIVPTPVDLAPYVKADGTIPFTGTIAGIVPTLDAHLSTKKYVDDAIIAHASPNGIVYVSGTVENTTQVMANVTGLAIPLEASKIYVFDMFLDIYTDAATNGIWYQFTGPAAATKVFAVFEYALSGTSVPVLEVVTAFSAATSAVSQATAVHYCRVRGIFSNGVNSGTAQLQFRNEAAAHTCRVLAGSYATWYKLN